MVDWRKYLCNSFLLSLKKVINKIKTGFNISIHLIHFGFMSEKNTEYCTQITHFKSR